MKKARIAKGKCATYSYLTFESHELFRLCSIATVIFFPDRFGDFVSAPPELGWLRELRGSSWIRSLERIVEDRQNSEMITLLLVCLRVFKNCEAEYRQDAFPARHPLISSERYQRPDCCAKKEILKASDWNNYSPGSVGFMDRHFLMNACRAYILEEVIRRA